MYKRLLISLILISLSAPAFAGKEVTDPKGWNAVYSNYLKSGKLDDCLVDTHEYVKAQLKAGSIAPLEGVLKKAYGEVEEVLQDAYAFIAKGEPAYLEFIRTRRLSERLLSLHNEMRDNLNDHSIPSLKGELKTAYEQVEAGPKVLTDPTEWEAVFKTDPYSIKLQDFVVATHEYVKEKLRTGSIPPLHGAAQKGFEEVEKALEKARLFIGERKPIYESYMATGKISLEVLSTHRKIQEFLKMNIIPPLSGELLAAHTKVETARDSIIESIQNPNPNGSDTLPESFNSTSADGYSFALNRDMKSIEIRKGDLFVTLTYNTGGSFQRPETGRISQYCFVETNTTLAEFKEAINSTRSFFPKAERLRQDGDEKTGSN